MVSKYTRVSKAALGALKELANINKVIERISVLET